MTTRRVPAVLNALSVDVEDVLTCHGVDERPAGELPLQIREHSAHERVTALVLSACRRDVASQRHQIVAEGRDVSRGEHAREVHRPVLRRREEAQLERVLLRRANSLDGLRVPLDEPRHRHRVPGDACAVRGVEVVRHRQHDPRERVVSIAHYGLVPMPRTVPAGDDKIDRLEWIEPGAAQGLNWAFDHGEILKLAVERLRSKIQYAPVSTHFLPKEFTLSELALVYGAILGRKVDASNFRRDLTRQNLVVPAGSRAVRGPTATTYRWNWENKAAFFLSLG